MFRPLASLSLATLLLSACSADLPEIELGPDSADTTDALRLSVLSEGEVSVSWYRDDAEIAELQDALEVSAERTAKGQRWSVLVWPGPDPDRSADTASQLEITIANAEPTLVSVVADDESPPADQDLVVSVEGSDPDEDLLFWRYEWLRDGEVVKGQEERFVDSEQTVRGETWTVNAYVSDGEIEVGPVSATLRIGNVAPVANSVGLGPSVADETTELIATPEGVDADGDVVLWSYAWLVDGVLADVPATQGSLTGTHFNRGQEVQVIATPSDGSEEGEPVASRIVTISNAAPSATAATISPAEPREGDTLSCTGSGFVDPDGDAEEWRTSWTIDGSVISGAPSLTSADFNKGDEVVCTLTPFDGSTAGEPVVASVVVLNTAPTLASATLPTEAFEGDSLTVTLGAAFDADGDEITYDYAWTVDGTAAGTAASLGSDAFDRDQSVIVTVTPNDGSEDGVAMTSAALVISNTAPVVDSLTLTPSAPGTDDDVVAAAVLTDADGDSVSASFVWSVDGVVVAGATGSSLSSSAFERGQVVRVEATPNDGTDTGAPIAASAIVVNTAPTLASVSIDPGTVFEDTVANCLPSGFSDPDGDEASYTWSWSIGGTEVATTQTLEGDDFDKSDVLICTATPTDGTDDGAAVSSASVTVSGSIPSLDSVSLSPATVTTTDAITAVASATDLDGDSISFAYTWYLDSGGTGSFTALAETGGTLASTAFSGGDIVYVDVVASDADGSTAPLSSAAVTIANTAPTAPSAATLTPADPGPTDTISCTATGATDADGDSLSYVYRFYNGSSLVGTTTAAGAGTFDLSPSNTMPDDVWSCTANAYDGLIESDASAESSDVVVGLSETCDDYYSLGYRTSGDFLLDTPTGGRLELYCEFRTDGGWTEVIDDDYASDACVGAWVSSTAGYGGECIVNGPAARQATIATHGISYSEVRVDLGLSAFSTVDGFGTATATVRTQPYADGFALLYNDGGWDDVHTWTVAHAAGQCATAAPFTLSGGTTCVQTTYVASSWSTGLDHDGFNQYTLGGSTSVDLVGQVMTDQADPDENVAVRHLTILVK